MENAAKALLIAGGVLIAILLLTFFVYINRQMASSTSSIYGILNESDIAEFNQQFLNYKGKGTNILGNVKGDGKVYVYDPLTVQDVTTIVNLVQDCNQNKKFPTNIVIKLKKYGGPILYSNLANKSDYDKWWGTDKYSNNIYACTSVNINSSSLLVNEIVIEQLQNMSPTLEK